MKPVRLISLLTFVSILFGIAPSVKAADTPEEKFHLVYLVSADKVEVGAKAFVEPLFLTNGQRFVFAYDYCRQHFQRQRNLPEMAYGGVVVRKEDLILPNQITSDLTAIDTYCDGNETIVDFSTYTIRDSTGLRLGVKSVVFAQETAFNDLTPGMVRAPVLPARGRASILAVEGHATLLSEMAAGESRRHFFLAAEGNAILDRIMPVLVLEETEVYALKTQIHDYTKQRIPASRNDQRFLECDLGYPWDFKRRKGPYRLEAAQLVGSTIADIDRDGRADAIVALKEDFKESVPANAGTAPARANRYTTTELRIFYGKGRSQCYAWSFGEPKGIFPSRMPMAVVWIGGNGYAVIAGGEGVLESEFFSVLSMTPPDAAKRIFPGSGLKYVMAQ